MQTYLSTPCEVWAPTEFVSESDSRVRVNALPICVARRFILDVRCELDDMVSCLRGSFGRLNFLSLDLTQVVSKVDISS